MASEDSIYDSVFHLCNQYVPALKHFYGRDVNCNLPDVQITKKQKIVKKFHKITYGTLLKFSQPNKTGKDPYYEGFSEIHSVLAIVYNMRTSRKFDDANSLESLLNKLKGEQNHISDEIRSCLRLLICLYDTGKVEKPCLGELQPYPKVAVEEGDCCLLPPGPMVYGDTHLANKNGFFTLFPREVFEEVCPVTITPSAAQQTALFEMCPGYDLNGNELFNISTSAAFKEEKDDSQSLLGALFHRPRVRQKNLLGIKLEIPEISSSLRPLDFKLSINSDSAVGSSIKKSMINTLSEDEGFIESDSPLSARSSGIESEDIWDAAMKLKPRTYFSWETIGCYSVEKPKPYLTEAGPKAVDMIYQTHQHEMMLMNSSFHFDVPIAISQSTLSRDVISLLIGIPSETFLFINSANVFEIHRGIYISGMTPESLAKFLSCFIETGSLYRKLEEFSSGSEHGTACKEGLVMQALKGSISRYLQHYRASVLSVADENKDFTILQLKQKFRSMCQQIRFLSNFCKIVVHSGSYTFMEQLPVGIELLTYIYEKSLELWGQDNYLLSLYLLKSASAPYLHFLHEWLFEGVCNDSFSEFHVQQNFLYLNCKDEMYWTKCFLQTTQDVSKCVPQFLSHVASDILVCGKSVNLLKLCCPKHYLCSSKAELPPLVLSFSELVVNRIKTASQQYLDNMLEIAQEEKRIAEQQRQRQEEEKHLLLQQTQLKRSETLAKIQEQLEEAYKTSEEKKQKHMSDLKAQIEENNLLRQLEKEKLIQEENKLIALIEEQREKEMQIKKEIETEFQKRALELEKREQHAKLLYEKLQKDPSILDKLGTSDLQQALKKSDVSPCAESSACEKETPDGTSEELCPSDILANKVNSDTLDQIPAAVENIVVQKPSVDTVNDHKPPLNMPKETQPIIDDLSVVPPSLVQSVTDLHPVQTCKSVVSLPEISQAGSPACAAIENNTMIPDSFRKALEKVENSARAEKQQKRRSWSEYLTNKAAGDVDDVLMSPSGVLFSSSSRAALKSRGVNVHGHASDSTIQDILYGGICSKSKGQHENKPQNSLLNEFKNEEAGSVDMSEQDAISNAETNNICGENVVSIKCNSDGDSLVSNAQSKINAEELPSRKAQKLENLANPRSHMTFRTRSHDSLQPVMCGHHSDRRDNSDHECEGELRSTISQTVLKQRGKNIYGHSSDSTIQDVMYGKQNEKELSNNMDTNMLLNKRDDKPQNLQSKSAQVSHSLKVPPGADKEMEVPSDYVKSSSDDVPDKAEEHFPDDLESKEATEHCSGTTGTSLEMTDHDGELASVSYTPTYCKNFPILDKQPLPGLMRSIPKNGVTFASEEDRDISSCHYTPLLALISRSLLPVIQAQIKLVNKSMIDYFIMNLNINDHFMALRNFFFFHDGEFGHSLSQLLFDKLSQCHSPVELLSPFTLNAILSQALSLSLQGDSVYADRLSFAIKSVPLTFLTTAPNALNCIKLMYRVEWPCNIVITEKNMVYYNSVLELLLQVKRCHWSLTDVWFHLKRACKYHNLDVSPQYRQLQIYRHEMLHFARVMQSYIASQVLQVTWKEFQNILEHKVNSLDDLRDAHVNYLKKSCYRCLLSKKAAPVMKIIKDVLSSILKYRSLLLKHDWILNTNSGHLEHPAFDSLVSTYRAFHEHSCFLYKVLTQLVLKGYQPHLKDFLVKLDFNDFYQTVAKCSEDITEDFPS